MLMDVVVGPVGRVVVLNRFSCRAVVGLQVWWAGVCFCHLLWVGRLPTSPSPPNLKPLWLGCRWLTSSRLWPDFGQILVSATRPHGGAASFVGWGLVGGRQRAANGKNKYQPTKCATYYYRVYPVENVI